MEKIVEFVTGFPNFIKGLFNGIGDLFQKGFDLFAYLFDKYIQPILDFFGGLLVASFNMLLELLGIVFAPLFAFIEGFFNLMGELFKFLFIPNDDFLSSNFSIIEDTLSNKVGIDLSILDGMSKAREVRGDIFTPIVFTVFGHRQSIDLSFLSYAQPYTRALGTGLVAIFLCWYHYSHVLFIIRKVRPIGGDGYTGQNVNNLKGAEK